MKEKTKNKIIGKIITTTVGTNINSNNSLLLTNNNQINNNKNIKSPSIFLPFKGTYHHKRAHSSFKFKNISENVKNNNISNKINLNTIIASINNYKSLGNNEKLNKISIINNNKNRFIDIKRELSKNSYETMKIKNNYKIRKIFNYNV